MISCNYVFETWRNESKLIYKKVSMCSFVLFFDVCLINAKRQRGNAINMSYNLGLKWEIT